jgi:glycosyltransferase involved in cell wall biosynthesis
VAGSLCVLLLPRTLEQFILRDQAEDLLRAASVIAVEPAQLPYGAFGRLPEPVGNAIAATQARRLAKRLPGEVGVVVIFHPLQYQLARALIARSPGAELWYGRWDRYEEAYDAGPRLRERLRTLHDLAAQRSALTFAASDELVRLERAEGRDAVLVPLAADSFPALDPSAPPPPPANPEDVAAVSLGHLGWRTDWALLHAAVERMPELRLLLVGAWHEDESGDDEHFRALRASDRVEWLGRLDDEKAAAAIQRADVGIVPFKADPFNQAALPYRIIKYARQGRRTVSPELAGAHTWERAVTFARDIDELVAALRAARGARSHPDLELRQWALEQTAWRQNAPLWDRLEELGIAGR